MAVFNGVFLHAQINILAVIIAFVKVQVAYVVKDMQRFYCAAAK